VSTALPHVHRITALKGSAFLSNGRSANLNACRTSLVVRRRNHMAKTAAKYTRTPRLGYDLLETRSRHDGLSQAIAPPRRHLHNTSLMHGGRAAPCRLVIWNCRLDRHDAQSLKAQLSPATRRDIKLNLDDSLYDRIHFRKVQSAVVGLAF
jgi:hypothetical protein